MVHVLGLDDLHGAVVLVVHAHPDDEAFATGAATIAAQTAGATVHLRLFTGGEGRRSALSPAGLAEARRRKEVQLAASASRLGIDTWGYLTEPGRWTDTPHAPERTIATAGVADLAAPVIDAIEALRPDVLLTVGPDGLTGHPDHVACHHAVRRALTEAAHAPRTALGAVLDRDAVETAVHDAAATFREAVGSGRVTGAPPDLGSIVIIGPHETEPRRRQALDAYAPALGTAPSAALDIDGVGAGDSVLLRFVLDSSGWERDRFVQITRLQERPGSPDATQ